MELIRTLLEQHPLLALFLTIAAVFAYAAKLVPSDRVDIGYATTFPGMTLAKILFVDLAKALT